MKSPARGGEAAPGQEPARSGRWANPTIRTRLIFMVVLAVLAAALGGGR